MKIVQFLSRNWASRIYAAFVPVGHEIPKGVDTFLEDLWRHAPWRITLGSLVALFVISILPPVVMGRFTVLHRLSLDEQLIYLQRLSQVQNYVLRLMFLGVKSQALVAVLRDEQCRQNLGLSDELGVE